MSGRSWRLLPLIAAASAFVAFLPTLGNGWVAWDDPEHFLNNPHYRGLGWTQLRWMFTSYHASLYHPMAWLTLGLDYKIWDMEAGGYHLTSLLIHAANAWLFYRLALSLLSITMVSSESDRRLAALFSALFFALHPLRVESVAWVAERRDVLCGFFYLLTLLAYLRGRIVAAFAAFAAALLSKATPMTLPFVLLVLDVYPLKRGPRFLEKIPFMAAAFLVAGVAYIGPLLDGKWVSIEENGFPARLAVSCFDLAFYLVKTAAPAGLLPLYEAPVPLWSLAGAFVTSAAGLAAATIAFVAARRPWPAGLCAWLAYFLTALPVLGFVRAGPQIAADRFTYLSCMPWSVLAGAGLLALLRGGLRAPALIAAAGWSLALATLTWRQTLVWRDSEALWRSVLAGNPRSAVAHNNMAGILAERGRYVEAEDHARRAIGIVPAYGEAFDTLGTIWRRQGKSRAAMIAYERAARVAPTKPYVHAVLGLALAEQGRFARAREVLQKALDLGVGAKEAEVRYSLAGALAALGQRERAIQEYEAALRLRPTYAEAHNNLGLLLAEGGGRRGAEREYRAAASSNPRFAPALYNWANLLSAEGRSEPALRLYKEALRLDPRFAEARLNLGNELARRGRFREAAEAYQEVLRLGGSSGAGAAAARNLSAIRALPTSAR